MLKQSGNILIKQKVSYFLTQVSLSCTGTATKYDSMKSIKMLRTINYCRLQILIDKNIDYKYMYR